MTSLASPDDLIRARFEALVTNGTPPVPTRFDNLPGFTEPEGAAWAALEVVHSGRRLVDSIGTYRTLGSVIVQIRQPLNRGTSMADAVALAVDEAFGRRTKADGVLYRAPERHRRGPEIGKWWRVDVVVPFQFDEILN